MEASTCSTSFRCLVGCLLPQAASSLADLLFLLAQAVAMFSDLYLLAHYMEFLLCCSGVRFNLAVIHVMARFAARHVTENMTSITMVRNGRQAANGAANSASPVKMILYCACAK